MPDVSQRVLVTGASGFVGLPLCALLARNGMDVIAGVRRESAALSALAAQGHLRQAVLGDIAQPQNWFAAFEHVRTVVHLAARVHIMADRQDPALYHRTNVDGTLNIARAAARAGTRRFVLVSSVKAAGDTAADPYGRSKAQAEQQLLQLCAELGMESVVVRPPLVYGPGVRANFLRLMRMVDSGLPIPLGGVHNRRSIIYVGNLADALRACIVDPGAAGHAFSVRDAEDVSTPELVKRIAIALHRPARLFPVPPGLLRLGAALIGQSDAIARLTGDLVVDDTEIRTALAWQPPHSMEEGLAHTADWYIAHLRNRARQGDT